ncbi:DNA-directed RNA polymerase subunit omega [Wolbachia pipientis]|uniref:DNA-directed RNA polymerase subunit omega n=1 Tax=Wolbachia pipientis TaxID=955 RepID=A0A1E7QKG1_WOLPI|nr:DNA-directed RNA polymerase subunit omega [Wolbachia pipientis]OEY86887.1 DNA-directed RNA polymerase subunit omega [Wolbachia pipientis]
MTEFIVEKCIEQISNRFKLVLLASQRAHDLSIGSGQVARSKNHKSTIVALYEIADKKVSANDLFNLLVGRCKEYMQGNLGHYSHNEYKLEKLLQQSNFGAQPKTKNDII